METNRFLSSVERQNQILEMLAREQRLSVAAICDHFSISEATARRDLESLDTQGKLQRVHGGAISLQPAPPELSIVLRKEEQIDEKLRIGAAAAELIEENETIFLGSGTTVLEVARNLRSRHLTVITNSLPVINTLYNSPSISLVVLGGLLRPSELSFIGHITEQSLADLRAEKVIIGTHAIHLETGLSNDYLPETMTDRAIMRLGRKLVVVADHTKFGMVSTALLAPINAVHTIVTDDQTPDDFITALRQRGIQVVVA